MSDGHCFISYSNRDAKDFGTQLANELEAGNPFIEAWFDKRDIPAGSKWSDKVPQAIQSSTCILFALTKDSVSEGSICSHELDLALRYKKPILIIRLQEDIEPPFRLGEVQWIDFLENRKAGLAKLRLAIQRVDSPEGQLDLLKARLSAANRDLSNAKSEEEKLRVQSDIDELTKQIEVQQKIVENPQAAEEQTQKNIDAGLERERKPQLPMVGIQSTKFINPPPGIAPNYFQDRTVETKLIFDFLNDDAQRLMTIIGRGGVGKTAMICRLLKHLENGAIPDDLIKSFGELNPVKIDGIVYLSESGSHRVNFANIFYDLCKLLPNETAQELDAIYKNPQASTESKMRTLLEKFSRGCVVLLLDNFEPLVNETDQTFPIRDTEIDEALRAFLNGIHTCVKIIITSRVAPKELNLIQPGRQKPLDIDDGLLSPYAENILREMDTDGRLGLKPASDELLSHARERTRGYPRALEALFAILAADRYTTLTEILDQPTPKNVVEDLVGEAFNRLDSNAQKVMQALAIYNRPVTSAAIDYLLAPHIPAIDSAPILQRLANMHFARKESGRFYLHPVDREFAFNLIPEKDLTTKGTKGFEEEDDSVIKVEPDHVIPTSKTDEESLENPLKELEALLAEIKAKETSYPLLFTQHDLLNRAADYFAQARKPRAEWKKLEDLSAQLAEFDLRCAAGDYDTAASILIEIDDDYLGLWGHYHILIRGYAQITEKIADKNIARISTGNLGWVFYYVGQAHKALDYFETALKMARETKNRQGEGAWLGNLGNAHAVLGNTLKAIEYDEQSLAIAREIGDRKNENGALSNLGSAYADLGDARKAIEYYEQALVIEREIGDLRGQGVDSGNIAEQRINLGEYDLAIESAEQYVKICKEINKPAGYAFGRLAQAYLHKPELIKARKSIDIALNFDEPHNNHNISALHGIIALRQGDEVAARGAFVRAIGQADEILSKTAEYYSALDAKGLALSGLAICDGKKYISDAIECFQKARKIAPHAGIIKRNLRLFDELAKCDTDGILKDVRKAVEGK